jgi:N-acyl-D-amino-acid deacylase
MRQKLLPGVGFAKCVCFLLVLTNLSGQGVILGLQGRETTRREKRKYDLLIRGGHIVDGTGNPWYESDIAVSGDRIGKLGEVSAKRVLEASGLVVAPGFIDMLGQSEIALLVDNRSESKLSQGITTEITGEGQSVSPQNTKTKTEQNIAPNNFQIDWETLDEYFQRLEQHGTPLNLATYVGAEQVRRAVVGLKDRRPDVQELDEMQNLVRQAMRQGAVGLSTALIYPPGSYAKTDELVALAAVAGQYGGIYATHLRSQGAGETAALEEALRIGREAHVPVEIFHLKVIGKTRWGTMPKLVSTIQAARNAGQDVTADMYPYVAGGTSLSAILPPWVADQGTERMLERLQDPVVRQHIRSELTTDHEDWENLYLASGGATGVKIAEVQGSPALQHYVGMTVAEIAAQQGKDPVNAMLDFIIATRAQSSAIFFEMNEVDVQYGLKQPWVSLCLDSSEESRDGPLFSPHTHPRTYGSFPRFLGHYVRDLQLMPLEEAIRKMTSLPAQRLQLKKRGLLKEGFFADITLFDPRTIAGPATYENPTQLARGVKFVLVNGKIEYDNGKLTGVVAGRPLRGPGWQGTVGSSMSVTTSE